MPVSNEDAELIKRRHHVESIDVVRVQAKKPQYEVGSSAKLNFSAPKSGLFMMFGVCVCFVTIELIQFIS